MVGYFSQVALLLPATLFPQRDPHVIVLDSSHIVFTWEEDQKVYKLLATLGTLPPTQFPTGVSLSLTIPTVSPSFSPTNAPTFPQPSRATIAPTISPTRSPSTKSPTASPNASPDFICPFISFTIELTDYYDCFSDPNGDKLESPMLEAKRGFEFPDFLFVDGATSYDGFAPTNDVGTYPLRYSVQDGRRGKVTTDFNLTILPKATLSPTASPTLFPQKIGAIGIILILGGVGFGILIITGFVLFLLKIKKDKKKELARIAEDLRY